MNSSVAMDLRVLLLAVIVLSVLLAVSRARVAMLEREVRSLRDWAHRLNNWFTEVTLALGQEGAKIPPPPPKEVE